MGMQSMELSFLFMKGLQIGSYVIDKCHPKLLLANAFATTFWQFATSHSCVFKKRSWK